MPGKKYRSLQDPELYEAVKRRLLAQGKSAAAAKTSAARISNARVRGHRVRRKK